jgi:hypothetical protein
MHNPQSLYFNDTLRSEFRASAKRRPLLGKPVPPYETQAGIGEKGVLHR